MPRRGGKDDRDDFGSWAQAKQACRERVARETGTGQGSTRLDFDVDTGNTARFQGHASGRRENCTATQSGRVTDFNTFAGTTKEMLATTASRDKSTTTSPPKDKTSKDRKSKDEQTAEPATDGSVSTEQTR